MTDNHGLLYAYLLNGQGGGENLDWHTVKNWAPEHGVLWVHLEYSSPFVQQWVLQEAGLDEITAEACWPRRPGRAAR